MYKITGFEEVFYDDCLANDRREDGCKVTAYQVRQAVFALMPEAVALAWSKSDSLEGETVNLPDGGTVNFLDRRNYGQGFISRSFRCEGGGMDAPLTQYLLLAKKEGRIYVAAVVWPRGCENDQVRRVADLWGNLVWAPKSEWEPGSCPL